MPKSHVNDPKRWRNNAAELRALALKFGQATSNFIVPEFIAWGDPTAAG